jgi:hypothetical protein
LQTGKNNESDKTYHTQTKTDAMRNAVGNLFVNFIGCLALSHAVCLLVRLNHSFSLSNYNAEYKEIVSLSKRWQKYSKRYPVSDTRQA